MPQVEPSGRSIRSPADLSGTRHIVDALSWSAGRVLDLLANERDEGDEDEPWGPSASDDPLAYRNWTTERASHGAARAATLPSTGPLMSVLIVVPDGPCESRAARAVGPSVRSVCEQRYLDWEVCVCCGPGTEDLVRSAVRDAHGIGSDRRTKVAVGKAGGAWQAADVALGSVGGEHVAFLRAGDTLDPDALSEAAAVVGSDPRADVVYSDHDSIDETGMLSDPRFKPDWSPEMLLSYPYTGDLLVVRRGLAESVGLFRRGTEGSELYDLVLRATERARNVVHVPRVLYHRLRPSEDVDSEDVDSDEHSPGAVRIRVLQDALSRRGIEGRVEPAAFPGAQHVRRALRTDAKVAIVIPFRDQAAATVRCLESLAVSPGYDNFEVVVVDNASTDPETFALKRRLTALGYLVVDYPGAFNWSAVNNLGASSCESEFLLFLNNDVEASSPGWLAALMELGQLEEVGVVGARLVMRDGRVQHAGVVLGLESVAGHPFSGLAQGERGYSDWDALVRPYSAMTGACLLTRRAVFESLDGFDEELHVVYNDTDYCMRAVDAGYSVIYTPHARFVHDESTSRGVSGSTTDLRYFLAKWGRERIRSDPFYNPNLGRFAPWCPLRALDEDEHWEQRLDELAADAPRSPGR
jgi:GT2 family glycosyltransferase